MFSLRLRCLPLLDSTDLHQPASSFLNVSLISSTISFSFLFSVLCVTLHSAVKVHILSSGDKPRMCATKFTVLFTLQLLCACTYDAVWLSQMRKILGRVVVQSPGMISMPGLAVFFYPPGGPAESVLCCSHWEGLGCFIVVHWTVQSGLLQTWTYEWSSCNPPLWYFPGNADGKCAA